MVLPFQHGIEIVGLIGSVLGADKPHLHIVVDDLFKGLAVLLVDCQHEKGQHDQHHAQRGRTGTDAAFQQKEQRDADQSAAAKAYKLPLCQIEHHFCFYLAQKNLIPCGIQNDVDAPFKLADDIYGKGNACDLYSGGGGCTAWVLHNENMDYLKCADKLSWDGNKTCNEESSEK